MVLTPNRWRGRISTQTHVSDAGGHADAGGWLQVTQGECFKIRISSWDTSGSYVVFEFVAEPRNGVPLHVHDNEEEHFIIVEGTLHMVNGNTTLEVTAGTSVTIRKGVPHAWCNLSDSPVRMLVVFTPGSIEELFRANVSGKAHDLEALARAYGTRIVGPPMRERLYTFASPRSPAPQPPTRIK
jgi:mannose-6-phosphate isomerase-like protein (cupin superfamily)